MANPLTQADRQAVLPALGETGWRAVPGRDAIRKVWKFRSFSEAWAFMSRAALMSEKLNHHPEWSNTYNVVDVTLTTHDARGLTDADVKLAQAMDRFGAGAEIQQDHSAPIQSLCEERAARR